MMESTLKSPTQKIQEAVDELEEALIEARACNFKAMVCADGQNVWVNITPPSSVCVEIHRSW